MEDKPSLSHTRINISTWINCPGCKEEYNKLCKDGLCFECHEKRIKKMQDIPRKRFDNFTMNKNNSLAVEYCKDYFNNDRGIFLNGSIGSGKTHLAMATYNDVPKTESKAFMCVPELLLRIRSTFNNQSKVTEKVLVNECIEPEYLFLDDIGAEKINDLSIEALYVIFYQREMKNKNKVFITSNYDLATIAKNMSDRISSRIVGMCNIYKLDDADYRNRTKEQREEGKK